MKILAIILNFCLIGVILFSVIEDGVSRAEELFLVFLFLLFPILNIIVIIKSSEKKTFLDDTLLFLYLKRRVMEEKKKIEELK